MKKITTILTILALLLTPAQAVKPSGSGVVKTFKKGASRTIRTTTNKNNKFRGIKTIKYRPQR